LSSSRKLPRSTKLSQPRLFLLQLDLQRVNAALERRDLLSAALAALLRALIAPNLFAAGLWNTNLQRRLKLSTSSGETRLLSASSLAVAFAQNAARRSTCFTSSCRIPPRYAMCCRVGRRSDPRGFGSLRCTHRRSHTRARPN